MRHPKSLGKKNGFFFKNQDVGGTPEEIQTNEPNRITHERHQPLKRWENTDVTSETLDDDIPTVYTRNLVRKCVSHRGAG